MKIKFSLTFFVLFCLAVSSVIAEGGKNLRYVAQVYRDSIFGPRTLLLNNNSVTVEVRLDLKDDVGRYISEVWVSVPARAFLTVPYDQLLPPGDFTGWLEVNPKRLPVGVASEILMYGKPLPTEDFQGERIWGFEMDVLPGEDFAIAVLYPELDTEAYGVFSNIIGVQISEPNFGRITYHAFRLDFGQKKTFTVSDMANIFVQAPFTVRVLGFARFATSITDITSLSNSPTPGVRDGTREQSIKK